jgi:O-antigen/teichoic acid export membrane protein
MSVEVSEPVEATASGTSRMRFWERRPALLKAGFSIFDQAIYSGTSFVTAVIVGRSLSTSELGVYYLTLTIVMVLFGIQDNLVAGPFAIYGARRRGRELATYTGSMWAHHAGLTLLAMLGIIALLGMAIGSGASDFFSGLTVLIVAAPLMLLREGIRRLTFARLKIAGAIALDAAVSALQLGGLIGLAYVGRITVANVFVVMAAACAVASVCWFFISRERPRPEMSRVGEDWRHNWAFAKWAVLSWLTVDTVPFVMPWIVEFSAGKAATGLFGACGTLIGVTNILVVGTGNFLRPKAAHSFAAGGAAALRGVLLTTGVLFALLFGLFTLCMVLAGDSLGSLVYGEAFRGTWPILAALAATVLTNSLGFTAVNGLWAVGRPRAGLPADIVQMAITLVTAAILVAPYGAFGAALAAFVGSIAGTLTKITTLHLLLARIESDAEDSARENVPEATDSARADLNPARLLVSVIIPTYNRADLLPLAIESALKQTRPADEIIVVDDGSTDSTAEVLAPYADQVCVLWQPNAGVSAARNYGIEAARGEVLIFLDSDDLLTPRCVELVAGAMEQHPEVGVVYGDCYLVDGNGVRLGIYSEVERTVRPSGMILPQLAQRCMVNMSSGTARKSYLDGCRYDESLGPAADYDFWRLMAAKHPFYYIPEPTACYRYHGSQMITVQRNAILDEAIEVQRRIMEMPEFAGFPRRVRASVYCIHGVKNALRGHLSVARQCFLRSIRTAPLYPVSYALLAISLLGDGLLQRAIDLRRQLRGNYIDGRAVAQAATAEHLPMKPASQPAPAEEATA